MIYPLLFVLVLAIFVMVTVQVISGNGDKRVSKDDKLRLPGVVKGQNTISASKTAILRQELDMAEGQLRAEYPVLNRMLGGYCHGEALYEKGGLEAAVKEMVMDWQAERETVIQEISRVLADNPDEVTVRAIINACCDAEFEEEGYRNWLVWLQGRFGEL